MVHCTRSISITHTTDEVFAFLTDVSKANKWRVSLRDARWITPPPIVVKSRFVEQMYVLGKNIELNYEVLEFVPNQKMVCRCDVFNFSISMMFTVEGSNDISIVTITLEANFSGALRLLEPMIGSVFNTELLPDLERLKSYMERHSLPATANV
jgi:hypothetical protein